MTTFEAAALREEASVRRVPAAEVSCRGGREEMRIGDVEETRRAR